MKHIIILSLLCFSLFSIGQQTILLPAVNEYNAKSIAWSSTIGTGVFPVSLETLNKDTLNQYFKRKVEPEKWLSRKLLQEHFIQINKNNIYFTLSPVLNVNAGKGFDLTNDKVFQNTRAIQIEGEILKNIAFHTSFYENQAVNANYLTQYYNTRGEQTLLPDSSYLTQHAFIPYGARTKPFKATGFDYGFSNTYIKWKANNYLTIQFGNMSDFIGFGKRSLLYSDYAANRTALKLNFKINDKFSYSFQNGQLTNLMRRQFYTTVEAPFEKKMFNSHYLNYKTEKLSLSLFEAGIWFREDSVRSERVAIGYYNPLPLVNTAIYGFDNEKAKHLVGLNFGYKINANNLVYSQFISDDILNKQFGVQLGYRNYNLFNINRLSIQLEANHTSDKLYQAKNRRLAYTHNNLPLAYALGNNTSEIFFNLNYNLKFFYINISNTYYKNEGLIASTANLFQSKTENNGAALSTTNFTRAEFGYLINPKTNLKIYGAGVYRRNNLSTSTKIIEVGIKSDLRNATTTY